MGVVFFIYNAVFSVVLVVIVLVGTTIAIFSKNPDTRYQPMRDDRGSFIKSQTQLNTELDALGATARGESKHGFTSAKGARIEEDEDSLSGNESMLKHQYSDPPRSPVNGPVYTSDNNMSMNGSNRHLPPNYGQPQQQQRATSPYNQSRNGSMTSQSRFRNQTASPSPWQRGAGYD